jgi:hypothetical protein
VPVRDEKSFCHYTKKSLKVSNLLENLGMVKQSCLKHATNEASFLKILVRDPSRRFLQNTLSGIHPNVFKNIWVEICLEPCFPYT